MDRFVVTLTPKARQDLDSIWAFTRERCGASQAETYIRLVASALDTLATGIVKGRDTSDIKAGYFRHQVGSHVVFYRLPGKGSLEVVRILNQRMNLPRHM